MPLHLIKCRVPGRMNTKWTSTELLHVPELCTYIFSGMHDAEMSSNSGMM